MLFSSYAFLFFFLPTALVGFRVLSWGWGPKAAKVWLTLASLVFYGWWNPAYTLLLLASMTFNFGLGRHLGSRVRAGRPTRGVLAFGVALNLALLGYFKYANFFVGTVNDVAGTHWELARVILPLGISFFTFTQVAYLVDAGRGVVCEYDAGDFLLFITFFPHLIAGPIIHHAEMMPQFAEPRRFRFAWDNLAAGFGLFAMGLFKKVVIADGNGVHGTKVFGAAAAGTALGPADAWAGVLAYTFQLYFDFSGYSDMAVALSRMFGITLPQNFNSPYQAVNLADFWRRWHMTLSRFLRDYLYIPLGGNRRGEPRRYLNLVLTMTLGGLWHGAAWTFVAWGLYHGTGLAAHQAWTRFRGTRARESVSGRWAARALTLLFVMVGWVLFRAADLPTAGHLLGSMVGVGPAPVAGSSALLKPKTWFWLVGLLGVVCLMPNTTTIMGPAGLGSTEDAASGAGGRRPWWDPRVWLRWELRPAWACVTGLLLAFSILGLSRAGEFLYYNF